MLYSTKGLKMAKIEWTEITKGLIKSQLALRNISYLELSRKLDKIGVTETPQSINSKLNRGSFPATFFIQCLRAIGCKLTIKCKGDDLYE